ncbi:p25-alpha family protein [Cardiosporidium cionae]|uniref:P25-alpha family protein n=1 Tax=Cardiosporidium cionae TaxID=476202 RepID=A0ABQ7JFP9_9APIC|nr:p25-alpha family protein [Cardiosporidium cionae]|eukprot:KAF8822823.1 p25-alpha family protein [Cardiosporidium cionae]
MSLWNAFHLYTLGKEEMDSRTFVKLCRENKFLDKNLTVTTCDLIFTKIKQQLHSKKSHQVISLKMKIAWKFCLKQGAKRITFGEFEKAVQKIAEKKGVEASFITEKINQSEGPLYTGTKAEKIRLYEDKSTYTGVHAHGGPTTVDQPMTRFNSGFSKYDPNQPTGVKNITLEQMCDRSQPTVRGVNKTFQ